MSIGISCFNIKKPNDLSEPNIQVENKTYNLLTYTDQFLVEAKSIKFLIDHGFDLNKLFKIGLKHYRGNDQSNKNEHDIRSIFTHITESKVPIVLHNAFIDLVFLYQNFYAELPDTSIKFLADLEEIFIGGIYDTKYIAEFLAHSNASFLEYLYKRSLYENTQKKSNLANLNVFFDKNETIFKLSDFQIDLSVDIEKKICHNYSTYGFCAKIETCSKSHDVNAIIQAELNKKKSNKKQNLVQTNQETSLLATNSEINQSNDLNQIHNAGLDSFMTGYVMLNYINKFTKFKVISDLLNNDKLNFQLNDFDLENIKNKVYLTGKDYPLMIRRSNFATTSQNHKEKRKNSLL